MFIAFGIMAFMPDKSYALVDASVYGGGLFKGEVEGNSSIDPKGYQYGLKAHYNTSLVPLIEFGIGGYLQKGKIDYDLTGSDDTYDRTTIGLDVNLILNIPIIHPYARFTYAVYDKIEEDKDNFCGYGLGAGIELTFIPFFRFFGEYMYDYVDHDGYIKSQNVNFGLKFNF